MDRERYARMTGWKRFLEYAGLFTWDYVIETGLGDPTKEEEAAITALGYYGKAITPYSVARIAKGLVWKAPGQKAPGQGSAERKYTITIHCVDHSVSEKHFSNLKQVAAYVKSQIGPRTEGSYSTRDVTQDGFGTDYCNFSFTGFTMADIGGLIGPWGETVTWKDELGCCAFGDDDIPDWMFRKLSPRQEIPFRKWARDNYIPGSPIDPLWHPVVRDECRIMNEEAKLSGRVR